MENNNGEKIVKVSILQDSNETRKKDILKSIEMAKLECEKHHVSVNQILVLLKKVEAGILAIKI